MGRLVENHRRWSFVQGIFGEIERTNQELTSFKNGSPRLNPRSLEIDYSNASTSATKEDIEQRHKLQAKRLQTSQRYDAEARKWTYKHPVEASSWLELSR